MLVLTIPAFLLQGCVVHAQSKLSYVVLCNRIVHGSNCWKIELLDTLMQLPSLSATQVLPHLQTKLATTQQYGNAFMSRRAWAMPYDLLGTLYFYIINTIPTIWTLFFFARHKYYMNHMHCVFLFHKYNMFCIHFVLLFDKYYMTHMNFVL